MANPLDQFKNPRIQRILERQARLSPAFVGLAGTTYGIICAFDKLDSADPQHSIAPCILGAIVFTGIAILVLLLALLAWDWLSNK
jgi:biopolymer transport protein ExbB/TolQ